MDGNDFIDFASELSATDGIGPAACRTVVSRAYYGTFHMALALVNEFGFFCRRTDNEHRWVQWHFQNCKLPLAQAIGGALQNLHESRKEADYHLTRPQPDSPANATACLLRAERFAKGWANVEIPRLLPRSPPKCRNGVEGPIKPELKGDIAGAERGTSLIFVRRPPSGWCSVSFFAARCGVVAKSVMSFVQPTLA